MSKRWQQLPGETSQAFAAFEHYREQPPAQRTISEAARRTYGAKGVTKTGNVVGRIRDWYARHEWEPRARAWDAHQAALKDAEWEQEARDAARRHAREASLIQAVLLAPAKALAHKLANDPDARQLYEGVSIAELTRIVDRAGRGHALVGRFERLSRGLADDRVEVTGKDGKPIGMTPEAAVELLREALGLGQDAGRQEVVDELAKRRRERRGA